MRKLQQQQEPQTTTETTHTIKGIKPMTIRNFDFNQADLDSLKDEATIQYHNREDTPAIAGAIITVSGDYSLAWLKAVQAHTAKGYVLHEGLPVTTNQGYFACYMTKPAKVQHKELELIFEGVERSYRAELEVKKLAHIDLIAEQTVAMNRRKREAELALQEAEELEAAKAEVRILLGDAA